jgi:ATP-dependent helicase YprA (DUF1998 family)
MALNPITFTEQVVDDFLRYQLTTYPLADTDLYQQLRSLLRLDAARDTPLRQGPFLSLSRPFKPGATVATLVAEGVFHPAMKGIVPYPGLRAHQEKAIRSIHRGDTTLVSTGTGSGKTETFLYPIISRCLELQAQDAPPGVVAVILYPMNALAEDQLERLRGLLAGTGIPFGMYVGKTPDEDAQVKAERLPRNASRSDYHQRLTEIRKAGQAITVLPGEERASRQTMRGSKGQPRILLTNVKQLELLLTRDRDVGLFAGAPLEFLVFDEAHTFRGAQGAETACLIRRLRTFCGRTPEQVRHIATSATMADPSGGDDAARAFARRFFGVDGGRVTLVREDYDELRWNPQRSVPVGPQDDPAALLSALLKSVEADEAIVSDAISTHLVALGGARLPRTGWQSALSSQLVSNELVFQLASLLERPRALSELSLLLRERVGREVSEPEIMAWLALGAATGRGNHDPLLRPVAHSFVRGVGGAVVTFSGPGARSQLWLSGEDASESLGDKHHRFPVITCTTCGQHYYETWVKDLTLDASATRDPDGGDLEGGARVWRSADEAHAGTRALLVDRLVVRPDEDDSAEDVDEDGEVEARTAHDIEHRRLHPMHACSHCGSLYAKESELSGACVNLGTLVPVQVVRHKKDAPGVLHSCVSCQAPGKRPSGGRYREPARPIRAVGVSDVHVLAQSMVHLSERPRLLVFADNRQDAAFQAGWMQDHARRFRLRALIMQQVQPDGSSIGDVVYRLDEIFSKDEDLSRALLPEVWQVVPMDASSTKHREERLYFLSIQVLREVATGVKQRLGLEPWGRLRIEYRGLSEDLPFIQKWAPQLGCSTAALVEGVGALLDHTRRVRVLRDEGTKLFERLWVRGNKEFDFGYVPNFSGGPRGLKLSRGDDDLPARVAQWVGSRPTQAWNAVSLWGVPDRSLEAFLTELWSTLVDAKLLVRTELTGWGKPLKGSAGVYQIESATLVLRLHEGRYRCEKCRRTTVRQGPTGRCLAWRCGGKLAWETEDADDFDLRVLDGDYAMLRVAEHSAQVPDVLRERYENIFKGESEQLNTLVCTPTLELGVDIGALDAVLMRNVPPTAANYWQRAGRAGRRHRMAVDVTYAQATGFDQAYFRDPLKLLGGVVEPPRFNLKNGEMIRKHVHATVLTALHGIARSSSDDVRGCIEAELRRCLPRTLKTWLFSTEGNVLATPLNVSPLGALIRRHRVEVFDAVRRAFTESWPEEDLAAVTEETLSRLVDGMSSALQDIIHRFKRRLDWALGELQRLSVLKQKKGVLDGEDQAHENRCGRVIGRLKGTNNMKRASAQGGPDDSETMSALAREGFLPGYGLESGSVLGTAELPRMARGLEEYQLQRPLTLALREYVPGNAIYANGFRFVPRRYQLTPDETLRLRVLPEQQVVQEVGVNEATTLGAQELRTVPMCDVILPSQSQISDEEEFRFQMSVAVYGNDRGNHRGGTAWTWEGLDLRFRRGVHLRLVNVGPRKEVANNRLGFPLCLACGQSHSPFASRKSREEFDKLHLERCGHVVQPTGFVADVEVDVLGLHAIDDRTTGFSVMEAIRVGASRVLDMEVEDLQLLAIGRVADDRCDVLLYDPMPGGSGLLEQLATRWGEVRVAAMELLTRCPSACATSCIDCLQTYRNRFYHEHLDRKRAAEVLGRGEEPLVLAFAIPEHLPTTLSTTGQAQTVIEQRFKRYLEEAGFTSPQCQHPIDLGPGVGGTIPDFFYAGVDEDDPGVCIYLDGMSDQIHGNPAQAAKDQFLREKLRQLGYEVVVVRSFELDDRNAVVSAIARIAKYLLGKEKQKAVRDDTRWFDRAREAPAGAAVAKLLRAVPCAANDDGAIPMFELRIAAGAFSGGYVPEATGHARVDWPRPLPGLFLARVIGDSMDRVAPAGSLCLWQHLGASGAPAAGSGEDLLVQREDRHDAELGNYTFKRLADDAEGRRLVPVSTNPSHAEIPVGAGLQAVARFLAVVQLDD